MIVNKLMASSHCMVNVTSAACPTFIGEFTLSRRNTTAQNYTFKDLKDLETKPLRHCEGDGKVTFPRPFLMLGKVTFDEELNVMERYCRGDVS